MENKKDIGRAFRDKLEPMRKSPDDALWNAINADLKKKKKRRIVPFWFVLTGASFVFLIAAFMVDKAGFVKIFPDSEGPKREVTNSNDPKVAGEDNGNGQSTEKTINPLDSNLGIQKKENGGNESHAATGKNQMETNRTTTGSTIGKSTENGKKYKKSRGKNPGGKMASASLDTQKKARPNDSKKQQNPNIQEDGNFMNPVANDTGLASKLTPDGTQTAGLTEVSKDSLIEKALAENKKPNRKKEPKDTTETKTVVADEYRTFAVFLYAAPTSYGMFSNKSSLDNSLDSLGTSSEVVFNYGGYLSFQYDEKWAFRFGIARTVLKLSTGNIRINGDDSAAAPPNFNNVAYAPGTTNLSVAGQFSNSFSMDVEQELSYFEFPIEVKYNFHKCAIGIDAIGGFSTLFLTKNTVDAYGENGGTAHLGETKNIFKAHFTANIGIGLHYKLAKNFQFNFEPMFKYHLKTGDIKQQPYSLLLQAGIEYTFNSKKNKKQAKK